ncbi:aminotransferase class I/II-fold pyridoxal phosphate-dependent enzyme [Thiomicrorhabdus sediminis]|uniref:Aminotransferase n=2 Tax=Thiomicrorhabdus sediminis TaxID=2580412 RepID=A0A4P9K802_9GAMM|nr:aminotransferase class I/II-fold pyridoxal phosphate-dependent enzyme [Thiomicrorhabdus sediminis]
MKILGQARNLQQQGREVIHLEVGEPDFASLDCLNHAANEALEQGLSHYTPSLGLPELRHKLADFYSHFYKASVSSNNIMLTPGASGALQVVLSAILDADDKVLMADPTYPCNRQFVRLLNAKVLSVDVSHETRFQLTLKLVQQAWQKGIKAVMIASPANPTGTVIEQAELVKIARFLGEKQAYLIVDEIYQGLVYNRPPESILANQNLPENIIVINSFSKYFGMTGWRLGWCIAPDKLMPVLERLAQNIYLAAPTPAQYAALRVLEKDALQALEKRRLIFLQRRDTLIDALEAIGQKIDCHPDGAFYLYWNISAFSNNSEAFCQALLEQTGVAITPGTDFSDAQGKHYVRIAYTKECQILIRAVELIAQFIQGLKTQA